MAAVEKSFWLACGFEFQFHELGGRETWVDAVKYVVGEAEEDGFLVLELSRTLGCHSIRMATGTSPVEGRYLVSIINHTPSEVRPSSSRVCVLWK